MNDTTSPPPRLLLLEEHALLRSTVAGVARQLELARVHEVARVEALLPALKEYAFDGMLLALDEGGAVLDLLERLRRGALFCLPSTPVAVMTAHCDAALAARLRTLGVRRVILKPFKAKTALETIAGLWSLAAA